MEERRLFIVLTVALALLALGGGFLALRLNAGKAQARLLSREAARAAALQGLSHAVACLNRRWPSEDCGQGYGPDYPGQERIDFSDGSSVRIEVTASASATRTLTSTGRSPASDIQEAYALRGEADIDADELDISDAAPSIVDSPSFGWRLRQDALIEVR